MTQQSVNISTFESQTKQNKKKCCGNKKVYIIGVILIAVCVLIGLLVAFLPVESDEQPVEPLPTGLRLPGSLSPISYDIKIQADINGNFSTKGHVDITFRVIQPTTYIMFHMLDIVTNNESIQLSSLNNPEENLEFKQHSYDLERQLYIGTLTAPLNADSNYTISLDYTGYLNTNLDGFYRSVYDKKGVETYLASTQFEPTSARKAFPCFDEPSFKATFDISLATEDAMTAISNMPLLKTEPSQEEEHWIWNIFETTPPMSTYLVAFTISDFQCFDDSVNQAGLGSQNRLGDKAFRKPRRAPDNPVIFHVCTRAENKDPAEYALDIGPKALSFYEAYFGIDYPLPKLDMLGIPDFSAGAMENWGLVTFREEALYYNPSLSSASNKQRVGSVISHELAHQWFGDLVTMVWWSDIWLNEGFATFMEYMALDNVESSFDMNDQFVVDELQGALASDCLPSSHPIEVKVENPDEINEIFDSISYSKGASIIRMMQYFLTPDVFQIGLQSYLNDLEYSNADQDELWAHMTKAAHEKETLDQEYSVKEIMDTWTLQMGYPVITVTRNEDKAKISQGRFLLGDNETLSNSEDYKWWVPLTYTTQDSPNFDKLSDIEWLKPSEKEKELSKFPTKDKWVIFNVQETGYYRVNYDKENWQAIENQLKNTKEKNPIGTLNRAQIVDDTLNLARAGLLSYDMALDISVFLSNELEYIPWASAMKNLGYLEEMFTRTSGYGALKDYLTQLATLLYKDVGFDGQASDNHMELLRRSAVLAWMCNLDYDDCTSNSVSQYNDLMNPPTNPSLMSPDVRSTVLCYGIAEGDEREWNFAWEAYLQSSSPPEKEDLMASMGCSKFDWILVRYLDLTFKTEDSAIRSQDAAKVFTAVAKNDIGRDVAWDYLKENWDELVAYYGSAVNLGGFIASVTRSFNTEADLQELLQLKEAHYAEFGDATQDFDQSIDNVKNNINWMASYYDTINEWLNENHYGDEILTHKY